MKVLLIVAVISCFFLVATAQNCVQRATDLSSCLSRITAGGDDFCNTCANTLISYYQDCASGVGVDAIKQGE